jgi:hypothetical protein
VGFAREALRCVNGGHAEVTEEPRGPRAPEHAERQLETRGGARELEMKRGVHERVFERAA